MEDALEKNITRFLLELGSGFAFIGRQKEIIVAGKTRNKIAVAIRGSYSETIRTGKHADGRDEGLCGIDESWYRHRYG